MMEQLEGGDDHTSPNFKDSRAHAETILSEESELQPKPLYRVKSKVVIPIPRGKSNDIEDHHILSTGIEQRLSYLLGFPKDLWKEPPTRIVKLYRGIDGPGLGLEVQEMKHHVVSVREGSSADLNKVEVGDKVLAIDDQMVSGQNFRHLMVNTVASKDSHKLLIKPKTPKEILIRRRIFRLICISFLFSCILILYFLVRILCTQLSTCSAGNLVLASLQNSDH